MLLKLKNVVLLFVFNISSAILNIYAINKFTRVIGIYKFRKRPLRGIDQVYFEDVICDTRIKMLDGSRNKEYYAKCKRGTDYELPVARLLKTHLEEFEYPTFVDIGAHFGYFTIYAGNLTRPNGLVISIEPHKKCYEGILKNIDINGLQKIVRTYNVALSDQQGKAAMNVLNEREFYDTENGEIYAMTFDLLCEKENIKPDIIKIDVHGAEVKVLQGMITKLRDVSYLFCETHNFLKKPGYKLTDIIKILEASGMEVLELKDYTKASGGELVKITEKALLAPKTQMLYARRK
jgi:FkbM family methyltransferase